MHDYAAIKRTHGRAVSQTIDAPIMVFDYFELGDAFAVLGIILVFGVLLYSWEIMLAGLVVVIGFAPIIRRRNERGIFLHWPYRSARMALPALFNPRGRRRFSD